MYASQTEHPFDARSESDDGYYKDATRRDPGPPPRSHPSTAVCGMHSTSLDQSRINDQRGREGTVSVRPPAVCVLQVQLHAACSAAASCVQTQLTDHWTYTSSACMYGPPAELSPYLVTPCLLRGVNRWPRLVHFELIKHDK